MNLNKVFLLGNLVSDPESRMTASGVAVANFRMATNRRFKDKNGQWQEQTEFHTVVTWGRQAEIAREYLKKGRLLFVEGRLQTRSWEGKDGQKRWKTEIIAERIQLGPRPGGNEGSSFSRPASAKKEAAPVTAAQEEIPVIDEDTPITFEDDQKEIDPKEIPF